MTLARAFGVLGLASFVTACTAILGAFDGSSSDNPGSTVDSGGPGDPAKQPDGAPLDDGSAEDAPVVCTAPELACDGKCVDPKTNVLHCGGCGRDCGGGTCTNGVCSAVTIYEDAAQTVGAFGVAPIETFFGLDDKLFACPNTGCTGAPRQAGQTQYGFAMAPIEYTDSILFQSAPVQNTERPALYSCPTTGCGAVLTSWVGDGLNGFVEPARRFDNKVFANAGGVGLAWTTCNAGTCASPAHNLGLRFTNGITGDANNIYFVDQQTRGGTIAKCAQTDTACVPTTLVPGDQSAVERVNYFNGRIFWLAKGRDDFHEGKILSCDVAVGCTSVQPIVHANGLDSPTSLVIDATGMYWFTAGGKIQRCLPNGCPGGPTDFASPWPTAAAHNLLTTAKFVYWAEQHKIVKLAK